MTRKAADALAERLLALLFSDRGAAVTRAEMVEETVGCLAEAGVPIEGFDRIEFDGDGNYRFFEATDG